jgi:hypothetical protein
MATVTQLSAHFLWRNDRNETTKKLEYLARMIPGAVKLNCLTIQT